MKLLSITTTLFIGYLILIACKSATLGPEFPITDFSEYDYIVVATVDNAVHEEEGYQPLKTFNITIKKCLKGNLNVGNHIYGEAKKEEARAVCPVHLNENSDYLLLLTKSIAGYRLSRFSFPVEHNHRYFEDYIEQIEKGLKDTKN
ncbi:MAG: hypothetical protein CL843_07805 [Crocinitomicaceae bacterium]|nr:hypothetical protein [Crocinitomicaceae bacterium]|tara:strand:- start:4047 stop:4484 length:438 start_codon:yes stop_codon:yes gene_type:complete